jgi:hypothetical protein
VIEPGSQLFNEMPRALGEEVGQAWLSPCDQPRAASPSRARAMMTCWIWLVPS